MSATEPIRTAPLLRVEYDQLVDAGLLEDHPVELLAGRKVEMTPERSDHASTVDRIADQLREPARAAGLQVRIQHPVALSDIDEPEPDVALVVAREDFYETQHPGPDDVVLLVEVARRSLVKDLTEKAERYAREGIAEYWVTDLASRRVRVHRDPDPATGRYRDVSDTAFGQPITALALANAPVVL